jgi:cytochrome P450
MARGRLELFILHQYSQEIPLRVTASMLGVSRSDWKQFGTWACEIFAAGISDAKVLHRVFVPVDSFFTREITKRRAAPADDLVRFLLESRLEAEPLSEPEIKETLLLILMAGIDATWSLIGASIWHLATHEEDRRRLVEEPELLSARVRTGYHRKRRSHGY